MWLCNARVFTGDVFREGSIEIKDGKISRVIFKPVADGIDVSAGEALWPDDADAYNLDGKLVIPGLIDIHLHGAAGADFCDGDEKAVEAIAEYELTHGVTAICAATMTLPEKELLRILETIARCNSDRKPADRRRPAADIVGINMEGPFISPEKKGAQDETFIRPCSVDLARRFLEASGGLVKFIGLAPEENPDFEDFIKALKGEVKVSLAHTNADYLTAKRACDAGASHAVHLYNAMSRFSHREPGVVGAVFDSEHVFAELICDGVHVAPAVVRATIAMLGEKRVVFVSDSIRGTGLGDGTYLLGGQEVYVEGKRATMCPDGCIAGSVANLMDCLRIAVRKIGIPLETAVRCATENPARALGLFPERGTITEGAMADLVILEKNLEIHSIIKQGSICKKL